MIPNDLEAEAMSYIDQSPGPAGQPLLTSYQNEYQPSGLEQEAMQYLDAQQPQSHSVGERAGQFTRGALHGAGTMGDIVNQNVLNPVHQLLPADVRAFTEQKNKAPIAERLTGAFEKTMDRSYEPSEDDTLGKIMHSAGEFATPIPGLGAAKTAGMISKAAYQALPAFGAATALHATPKLAEEGTGMAAVEDIAKVMIGGRYGMKAHGKAFGPKAKIAEDITKLSEQGRFKPREGLGKRLVEKGLSKAASIGSKPFAYGAKPDIEGLKLAEKHAVELPYNVGMGSRTQNFLANNVFKSIFTAKAYKDILEKSSNSMINAVRKSINHLGESTAKPGEISKDYKNFLDSEYKTFKENSKELYGEAANALKESDSVIPKHTATSINSDNIRSLLEADVKSGASSKVTKVISELADAWGIKQKGINLKEYEHLGPKAMSEISKQMSEAKKPISIKRLERVRSEILRMIDYDPEVRGVQANLSKLASDITKDIESSSNKEFINKWNTARKYYSDNMRNRFETDIARSIMTGEAPVEAFSKMNTVQNVDILEKAAGDSAKAKEIVKDLKLAKVREILSPAIEGSLENAEAVRTGALYKLFSKGEKNQELLERLVGKDSYKNLEEIGDIAHMFSKAGKDVLNTSGTAIAASDMDKTTAILAGGIHFLMGSTIPAAATTAAVYGASVNLASRLASSPRFVKEARAYAIARSQNKEKYAKTLLERMINTAKQEQKALQLGGFEAISRHKEEDSD